ncbi:MAG TPA: ribbon-helix-helix domain-containing protein [Alphaproteobacteria bacterium]|jgi:Arc/MetJ-type ribon-helix-helix transcriptional regulator|nr:ribbon-helix-helix domain-containing protein [Alphaproteobacteria bacterium]
MRAILNISLPKQMVEEIETEVSMGNFSTKSEFFRHILRWWKEEKLLKELNKGKEEIRAGKGVYLKSLADLR